MEVKSKNHTSGDKYNKSANGELFRIAVFIIIFFSTCCSFLRTSNFPKCKQGLCIMAYSASCADIRHIAISTNRTCNT